MYPFYEAGEKKTQKDKAVRDFLYINGEHQWRDVSPPPPRANPKTALSLGTESKRSPTVERQRKRLLYRRAFACSPP